jgi:hypothetical protein
VPTLTALGTRMSATQLTDIIQTGMGITSHPAQRYMPVFHGVISPPQIAAMVVYLRAGLPAVQGATPIPVPIGQGPAVAGKRHGRRTQTPITRHDHPAARHTRILRAVQHPTEDPRTDHLRQRDRPLPRRRHATLGGILTNADITDLIAYIDTLKRPMNGTTTDDPSSG